MCGRFALFRWNAEFSAIPGFPADQQPHWSLAPGAQVLLLRSAAGGLRLDRVRWGLTPAWLTDFTRTPAQARSETLAEQPMFREAYQQRRGLLPANGFYEWRGRVRKRPYWMTTEDSLIYFAALWERYPVQGQEYLSAAVVTLPAVDQRRPLLLSGAACAEWIDPQTPEQRLRELLNSPQPALRERPLATFVNDPALDAPQCLTPVN